MYIAQPANATNDRFVAGAVTSVFLMSVYLTLNWTGLPETKRKTDVYEEINWTRFKPKPEKLVPVPEPVVPAQIEKPIEIETPVEPVKSPQVEKIDLSSLTAQFETLDKTTTKKPLAAETGAAKQSRKMKVDLKESSMLAGLNTLLGENPDKLRLPNQGRRGRTSNQTRKLVAGTGTKVESARSEQYAGGATIAAPQGKDLQTSNPRIAMKNVAQLGDAFSDLSPVYHPLVEWMTQNPARLPEVVARFMEWTPEDLTSKVTFRIDGREFDMFLLCKQNLNEVRLCLVEGNESTYLIDRGFKERSSFLRSGGVNRRSDGELLAFGTTRKAASDRRTTEFYQIFLSWWDTVK